MHLRVVRGPPYLCPQGAIRRVRNTSRGKQTRVAVMPAHKHTPDMVRTTLSGPCQCTVADCEQAVSCVMGMYEGKDMQGLQTAKSTASWSRK